MNCDLSCDLAGNLICDLSCDLTFYLTCDLTCGRGFSGTHGYMAPEVLAKGQVYDSSADWFSHGCMLYKLLKGHSPFRQHKTKVRRRPGGGGGEHRW